MGRKPKTLNEKLKDSIKKDQKSLKIDGNNLICIICSQNIKIDVKRVSSSVDDHLKSSGHKKLIQKQGGVQMLIKESICSAQHQENLRSQFNSDLTEALISADIPLHKLNNKLFKHFLEKYTLKKIYDESTLRKNYVRPLYEKKH